jgi:predicted DNA-binding WGR domain protein
MFTNLVENCELFYYCELQNHTADKYWGCLILKNEPRTLIKFWGRRGNSPQIKADNLGSMDLASTSGTDAYYSKFKKGYYNCTPHSEFLKALIQKLESMSFAVLISATSRPSHPPHLTTQERKALALHYGSLLADSGLDRQKIISDARSSIPEFDWDLEPCKLLTIISDL